MNSPKFLCSSPNFNLMDKLQQSWELIVWIWFFFFVMGSWVVRSLMLCFYLLLKLVLFATVFLVCEIQSRRGGFSMWFCLLFFKIAIAIVLAFVIVVLYLFLLFLWLARCCNYYLHVLVVVVGVVVFLLFGVVFLHILYSVMILLHCTIVTMKVILIGFTH